LATTTIFQRTGEKAGVLREKGTGSFYIAAVLKLQPAWGGGGPKFLLPRAGRAGTGALVSGEN
jgi:hypothetical protein